MLGFMKTRSAKTEKASPLQSWYILGDTVKNNEHFHWFPARSYNCLTLGFGMLWSWKLHLSPIIILSQLGLLIISALFEKLLWASFLSATPFDSRVSDVTGFCFYLFQTQSCSQFSPYQFLMILQIYLIFHKKKRKKIIVVIRQCLYTFQMLEYVHHL